MIASQLELSVVCGVIFLSGVTATTFLLAFKNRKMHGFGEINSSFSTLNDCRVVCINRMGQQICIMFREALEKMVDPTRVKPTLQGVDPLLSSEKKILLLS